MMSAGRGLHAVATGHARRHRTSIVAWWKPCAFQEADLPMLTRGGGTSMCGQSVNAAVIIDASKYLTTIEENR
ncbi:hypothetical protein PT2222_490006 [Paraburkholderia tropica]